MFKKTLFTSMLALTFFITSFLQVSPVIAETPSPPTIQSIEPRKIDGTIKINNFQYKWMEASFGKNRGMTFNPGKLNYQFSPNPHNDPWYNKNQAKFYKQAAAQVETQGNIGKWTSGAWPSSIKNITVNKINYTLTIR